MEKSKSSSISKLKLLLVMPAALALFYIFACTSSESEITDQNAPETLDESIVYLKPDVAAEPAGGTMEFRKHLAKNIIYPAEAKKSGVQGKVFIQFVIDETGKVIPKVADNMEIPKPNGPAPPPPPATTKADEIVVVGYRTPEGVTSDEYTKEQIRLLTDEAIRVVQLPYEWTPAMKDGKPVKTQWTIPIQFVLQ